MCTLKSVNIDFDEGIITFMNNEQFVYWALQQCSASNKKIVNNWVYQHDHIDYWNKTFKYHFGKANNYEVIKENGKIKVLLKERI